MIPDILAAAGGLGLFLLGMLILTDGLRSLAGRTLRLWLARFTTTPATGAAAGALTTALVQSSSATTVTAVGFVGAGLLTFSQALGIIFGANLGTTITGWLVAIVGFKLDLGTFALPLLLLAMLLRLFAGGTAARIGWALAGFSLLFIGIDAMQAGMERFEGQFTPASFPDDSLFGRLQLLLIGVAITLVTQSSSAGVATALVALGAGAISFPQAAALVIGMDVGTTVTAAMATLGGSAAMRQTGYAHVIYNLMTGAMAFLLLEPLGLLAGAWAAADIGNAQIGLVAFHSCFNALGVLAVLPFTGPFARLIQHLVPERGPVLVRHLDRRLLREPDAAGDAVIATLREIDAAVRATVIGLLSDRGTTDGALARLTHGLEEARGFLDEMRTDPRRPAAHLRHQAALHIADHLSRLLYRAGQQERTDDLRADARLCRLSDILAAELSRLDGPDAATRALQIPSPQADPVAAASRFDRVRGLMRRQRRAYRALLIARTSSGAEDPDRTLARLDALRWLHRVAYHVWRIQVHLATASTGRPIAPEVAANADATTLRID